MTTKNRFMRGAGIGATALTAVLVAGCAGGSPAPSNSGDPTAPPTEPVHITVSVAQADGANGLPWLVGQEQGFFEANGIILDEIIPAEGGATPLQNVLAGDLPFGHVATAAIVNAHRENLPITVIAGAGQASPDIGWSVALDADYQSVEDLQDAVWGYTNPGAVTEAMTYLVPLYAGLDMDSIKRVATGGLGAGIALLEAGEVDVTFTAPQMEWRNPESLRVLLHSSDYVPRYQNTMIISSRDYAEKNPETTKGMLKALQASIEWIYDHPEEIASRWAEIQDIPEDVALAIIENYIEAELWGLAFNPEALKTAAEGLFYTDGIESVNWADILTDEYLPDGHKGTIPTN